MQEHGLDRGLPEILQSRLTIIRQDVALVWQQGPHTHFTCHGPTQSSRLYYQTLEPLIRQLPSDEQLSPDELFIISAAAWLYEIGMQCTNFRPVLDLDWQPGTPLDTRQLQRVRAHKHLLVQKMILDSVRPGVDGNHLRLGLLRYDDYIQLIADVCRWCSDEPLTEVGETQALNGRPVRVRLLVALLRLADRLYIDGDRIDIEQLQVADLPLAQKLHWWVYQYVQILPTTSGSISFHYTMPDVHKPLSAYIQAVVDEQFGQEGNPLISYLWDHHRLKLSLDKGPKVRFEAPSRQRRVMGHDLITYIRKQPYLLAVMTGDQRATEAASTHSLLVLDYENFIIQLGLDGYFPSLDELNRELVTLLKEARNQYLLPVNGLAVGHWNRPDLMNVAGILRELTYTLLTAPEDEECSVVLQQELQRQLECATLSRHLLLVAPHKHLASFTKDLEAWSQEVSVWITETKDDYLYQALASHFKLLPSLLGFARHQRVDMHEWRGTLDGCILRLDDYLSTVAEALTFPTAISVLKQVRGANRFVEWWRLFLLHQGILKPQLTENGTTLTLVANHPIVSSVYKKRAVVIATLPRNGERMPQDTLVTELARHPAFRDDEDRIVQFLKLLLDEDIVSVDNYPATHNGQSTWQLHTTHHKVVMSNIDHYLPLFTLGLDHALVRTGFPVLHEHTLKGRLSPYVAHNVTEAVYQRALDRNWLRRQQDRLPAYSAEKPLMGVRLENENIDVMRILLNRNILLDVLYHRSVHGGLKADALWSMLSTIRRFTLKRDELNQWLLTFQQASLIVRVKDDNDVEHDRLRLNLDIPLTQLLLGRMQVYNVILTMRILQANAPERGKNQEDILELLTKRLRRNRQLALWSLNYARQIRLVVTAKGTVPEQIFLNKHNIVQRLDQREDGVCRAVANLVKRLSRPRIQEGWVSIRDLIQEMEKDPFFGVTHEEFDYWVNQATHRRKTLEIRMEPGSPPKTYVRPK